MVLSGKEKPDTNKMRYFILLAILGAALAVPRNPQRIVGGEATTIDQYPFMANMQYGVFTIWWFQACGGCLISNIAILSAAHCYEGDSPANWKVRLGTSNASSGGTEFQVAQIILHEDYDKRPLDSDISVIKLTTAAVLSVNIGLARIAGPNYILADGTAVTAVGWGDLEFNGQAPEQLQHVELTQINQEYCATQYTNLKSLPGYQNWPDVLDSMICAGVVGGGKDACTGDSGGPLLHAGDIAIGITSWGYECAHADYPGVNTRVGVYADWIVANAS